MDLIIPVLIGIAVLSFLVFVHEAGHFLAAKLFGVKVEEFGFGFPFPGKIWSVKKGETTYSINWLPAGGFVRLYGEESGAHENDPRSFSGKPVGVRIIIAGAGVIINILMAILLFGVLMAFTGFKQDLNLRIPNKFPFGQQTDYGLIAYVLEKSPATQMGLKAGDKVVSIDGNKVNTLADIKDYINENVDQEITLVVQNYK